ncbi:sulfatase-like hydrolase/transferase [Carboxylicivirga marina]|uniref:Sulfatase-like hydrolase/transferase n=1 Tax=Carboxylicivirga marina TaxID=2800988 RepID=A0ABS1HIZ4_9BACT|nr:sulfatase-like hydrolase/transferase [Carboxylicivirga marina]MBK3517522.1 sulfatase-like hydrolase/transferase [Carboxylicivirga marina]
MKDNIYKLLVFLLILCTASNIKANNACKNKKKPNIIFLLADDLIYNSLGYLGDNDFKTPNLDKLAKQGITFTKSYNTTAICMASRAQYMTGLYEFSTGCNFTHGNLNYETWEQSYPHLLKRNGYTTGFAGKFGFHVDEANGKKGSSATVKPSFDWWCGWMGQGSYEMLKNKEAVEYQKTHEGEEEHTTYALGKMGAEFVSTHAKTDKPFCLSISFKAPHTPYAIDPRYEQLYAETEFNKPGNFGEGDQLSKNAQSGRPFSKGKTWMKDFQGTMSKYHTMVHGMDVAIGMIVSELEKQDIADNTIIIFTSDNGHFNGSKSLGGKLYAYEEGSRAPLIVYNPMLPKNKRIQTIDALSGNIDLAPTILDLAKVDIPEHYQGKSLVPVIEGKKKDIHESLMLINVWGIRSSQSLGIVTKDWKYIYWMYGAEGFKTTEELFDLNNDALEQNNLINNKSAQATLLEIQNIYDAWLNTWSNKMVNGNGYPKYVKLGDRNISFESHPWDMVKSMYPDQDKVKNKAAKKNKKQKKPKNNN